MKVFQSGLSEAQGYVVMQVVESLSGGVAHSIRTTVSGPCAEIPMLVVHGPRGFVEGHIRFPKNVRTVNWSVERELSPVSDLRALKDLRAIIRRERPTLIHAHSSKAGAIARVAGWLEGVPVLYSPRSYAFLRLDVSRLKRSLYWGVEKILAGLAITVACGLEEYSLARTLGGHVVAVENGVSSEIFARRVSPTEARDKLTFISIGRMTPQKDFPLFEKLSQSDALRQHNFVWITGEPGEDLQLHDNLTLRGQLDPAEVATELAKADIYVNTSLWEGLSRAVLEAAATGLPLLLRDAPGNREILFRGAEAKLFRNLQEAIEGAANLAAIKASDPKFGGKNSLLRDAFYDARGAQTQMRSIYDSIAFERLVARKK